MRTKVIYIVIVALISAAIFASLGLSLSAAVNKVYSTEDFYKFLKDSGNFEIEVGKGFKLKVDGTKIYVERRGGADPYYLETSGDRVYTYTYLYSTGWIKDNGTAPEDSDFDIEEDLKRLFDNDNYEYSKQDKAYKLKEGVVVDIEKVKLTDASLTVGKDSCEFVGKTNDGYNTVLKIRISNVGKTSVTLPEVNSYMITLYTNIDIGEYSHLITKAGDQIDLYPPVRYGYTFVGWFTDDALTEAFGGGQMPSRNLTLYAKWQPSNYMIYFETNGGGYIPPIAQPCGIEISPPNNPTKPDCVFVAWCSDSGLKNVYVFDTMPDHDIVLYAKWKPTKSVLTTQAINAVLDSFEDLAADLKDIDAAAYLSCTLYFEVSQGDSDNVSYEIKIKGNFDANNLDNNCGCIEITDTANDSPLLKVFVDADGTVFVGEAITKAYIDSLNWFRLSQAESLDFVRDYFSQLPSIIKGFCQSGKLDAFFGDQDTPISALQAIKMLGVNFLECEVPNNFDYLAGAVDGCYYISLKMSSIVSWLTSPLIGSVFDSLTPEMRGQLNLFLSLLGMAIVEDEGDFSIIQIGELPAISFYLDIWDGKLDRFFVNYTIDSEDSGYLDFKFGLKDFVISENTPPINDIKPYDLPYGTEDGAVKITFTLGLPQKEGFEQILFEVYVLPDFELVYDGSGGLTVENNITAYGFATVSGLTAEISVMYEETDGGRLVFDLAGLYELLGVEPPTGGTLYYYNNFNFGELLVGDGTETEEDTSESDFAFEALLTALACLELASDEGQPDDGTAVVDILMFLQYLAILELYPYEFLPISLEPIAALLGISIDEFEAVILMLTDIEPDPNQTLTDYLVANGLYLEMRNYYSELCDENGAGFKLTLRTYDEDIAIFGCQITFIPRSLAQSAIDSLTIADYNGGGINLADNAEYERLMEEVMLLLEAFLLL